MRKIIVVVLLLFVATVAQAADRATVVLVGGYGNTEDRMEYLRENIPGSVTVIAKRSYPLSSGAADVMRQITEKGITTKVVLVGYSWGGNIVRKLAVEYPDMVTAVVTIGSPSGGVWGCPWFVYEPGDDKIETPLYVVAGYKKGSESWFSNGLTDGVVDLSSALEIKRKVAGMIVLEGVDHTELTESETVVDTINRWIAPYNALQVTAMASLD